eukprot:9143287-Alexandrium_andersonii.AAC.1
MPKAKHQGLQRTRPRAPPALARLLHPRWNERRCPTRRTCPRPGAPPRGCTPRPRPRGNAPHG